MQLRLIISGLPFSWHFQRPGLACHWAQWAVQAVHDDLQAHLPFFLRNLHLEIFRLRLQDFTEGSAYDRLVMTWEVSPWHFRSCILQMDVYFQTKLYRCVVHTCTQVQNFMTPVANSSKWHSCNRITYFFSDGKSLLLGVDC